MCVFLAYIFIYAYFSGTNIGDEVSVYADLTRLCKKGRKLGFFGDRVFIGNGIVHMNRRQLFTGDKNIRYYLQFEFYLLVLAIRLVSL